MKLSRTTTFVGAAIFAAVSVLRAQVQSAGDQYKGSEVIFNLEFPGGTLREYVDFLRQAITSGSRDFDGPGINVSLSDPDAADRVLLPPLSLKSVSISTALDLVEITAKSDDYLARGVRLGKASGTEAPVYFVNLRPVGKPRAPEKAPAELPKVEVFSLRDVVGAGSDAGDLQKVETILSALKVGLELSSEELRSAQAKLHFHPESRLLFVIGSPEDVALIAEILERLGAKSPADPRWYYQAGSRNRNLEYFVQPQFGASVEKARVPEYDAERVLGEETLRAELEAARARIAELEKELESLEERRQQVPAGKK